VQYIVTFLSAWKKSFFFFFFFFLPEPNNAGEKYLNAVPQDADWERRALEIDKRFEPTPRANNGAPDDDVRAVLLSRLHARSQRAAICAVCSFAPSVFALTL
jgi:hypothetical protein